MVSNNFRSNSIFLIFPQLFSAGAVAREPTGRARNVMERVRSTEPTGEACKVATRSASEGHALIDNVGIYVYSIDNEKHLLGYMLTDVV